MSTQETRVEWIERTEPKEWLALFREVFGGEMSETFLCWKYRDAEKIGVGLRRDNKLVAFYGGMPRNVLCKGEAITAVQMGDVMVHPSERGAFTRKGAFWKVASTYLETCVGEGKSYPIAFGFPNRRAYMLGKRLDLYDAVDSLIELSWTIVPKISFPSWRAREWRESDMAHIPALWKKMARGLQESVVGVRDQKWLNERYLNHPNAPYRIITVHRWWDQRPKGIIILRERGEEEIEWIDMFGDLSDIKGFWDATCRYSREKGMKRLFCWITRSHANRFDATRPNLHDIDIIVPFNVLTRGISPDQIHNRWWLMAGDTDFK